MALKVTQCTTEYLVNPIGIGTGAPRFHWVYEDDRPDSRDVAVRIIVSENVSTLESFQGDTWDSKTCVVENQPFMRYVGKALRSATRYGWRCHIQTNHGDSAWSPISWFETGLEHGDWTASWIQSPETPRPLDPSTMSGDGFSQAQARYEALLPPPHFRKDFSLSKNILRARLHVCGLGYHEVHMNGNKIGDRVLDPAQTDYETSACYVTHDVTEHLTTGSNTLGLILGDGFYCQPVAFTPHLTYGPPLGIVELRITYADGSRETVGSDGSWRVTHGGPILRSNVYAGEVYDARRNLGSWCQPGYNDAGWKTAKVVESPTRLLKPQLMPPIKRMAELVPKIVTEPEPGVFVLDLGQNISGWMRLSLSAPRGSEIALRMGEEVDNQGMLDTGSTGWIHTFMEQRDVYIASGEGLEVWEPRFTYHGFRYVEVTGFPGKVTPEMFTGILVYTAVEEAGTVHTSNAILNQVHQLAWWSEATNLHSIPTDCPHREKCGWLGDAHVRAETLDWNFNMVLFWEKYYEDILASLGEGVETYNRRPADPRAPTNVAPGKRRCQSARPDWGSAMVQIPYYQVLFYGDDTLARKFYPQMKAWVEYLGTIAVDDIMVEGYGDWCAPSPTGNRNALSPYDAASRHAPMERTSTIHYGLDVARLAGFAARFGFMEDAGVLTAWASRIRHAFIKKFFDTKARSFGSQTVNAMALAYGYVPEGEEPVVAQALKADVESRGKHFTVGIHGMRHLFRELSRSGFGKLAVEIFEVKGHPGFQDLLTAHSATTLWERWGEFEERAMQDGKPQGYRYSHNHPMQDGYDPWFFQCMGGVTPLESGYRKVRIQPDLSTGVESVVLSYQSLHGRIHVSWSQAQGKGQMQVTLPAGIVAELHLPPGVQVTPGDPATDKWKNPDSGSVRTLGSGSHSFEWNNGR